MAKRKQTRRRKSAPQPRQPSPFFQLSMAVLLYVLALFLLMGGFGTGGALPVGLFNIGTWFFGVAAYLLPAAFIYWGTAKFMSEDHKMPTSRLVSVFGLITSFSALLFSAFATKESDGSISGDIGGNMGLWFGGAARSALDAFPASIMFAVFTLMSAFFAFGISPMVLVKLTKLFKRRQRDFDENDNEISNLKKKIQQHGNFTINEGTDTEPEAKPVKPIRLNTIKNTAERFTPEQNHEALTTISDPDWKFPSLSLLNHQKEHPDAGDVNANAAIIQNTFANFSIDVEMEGANVGPRVTQYTLKPPTGVKLTKITALDNNLALDLAAHSIRMEAPIPGKRAVGIEVPNRKYATVRVSEILQSREWADMADKPLAFAIGKDISGKPVVADLAKMPHLLVAGQTGSGKSVMINTILTSLVFRNSPSELKLILVDPKQVELTPYNGMAHLLTPVINEAEKAISALKWAVSEMERRLKTMAKAGNRNIIEYNNLKQEEGMPYIVIVIDELMDLMAMAGRDVEALVVRLAAKSRAAGIHLVLATQRPSVDVITGLIKANIPGRIAFTTQSQVDSRTIIDQAGAEKLLGMGDMLLLTSDMPKPKRVQGAFISDDETAKITGFICLQRSPQYDDEVISQPVQLSGRGGTVSDLSGSGGDNGDAKWEDAVGVVIDAGKASTSLLQRRLRLGYGRASRIIEMMEEQGIVGPQDGSRPRDVLVHSMEEVFGSANSIDDEDNDDDSYDRPS